MGRLGYAASNLAERELLFGYDLLQQQMRAATFPFLSANLVYQDSGETLTQPSIVRVAEITRPDGKKRKVRVGVLGLARMNPGLAQQTPDGRRIVTADPADAARKVLPGLRKKSDIVVALVTLDLEEAKSLAKEVPGIDLILGGYGATLSEADVQREAPAGKARILYAGNQGKKLGEVRVFIGEKGQPTRMDFELVTLGKMVPDDPGMMDLVEKNRLAINEIHRNEAPLVNADKIRAAYEGTSYVLASTCKACHEGEYRIWEGTKHAHAFQTLMEKHQDYNPDCVGCHTTGFRQNTGYLNAKSTPDLMNVQCEACHGPGKNHPEKVGEGYGRAGPEMCLACHTAGNSPDFDAAAYRAKIRHWGDKGEGGLPPPAAH